MANQLVVIETHPVQYHAPVYRILQQEFGIPVTAIYGSDFSVAGYHDKEFDTSFAWDTDLLSGYTPVFLSRTAQGGAQTADTVDTQGLESQLQKLSPPVILLSGYSPKFYRQALWLALRSHAPLMFRAETTDHGQGRSTIKHRVRDFLLRRFYKRCEALLYIGQQSQAHYRRLGCPEQQLIFSPYGIDTTSFAVDEADRDRLRDATRQALNLRSDQLGILFSGKLIARKNPDWLLQAMKALPAGLRARMVLIFLGDGPLKTSIQQRANTEPVIQVRFTGFQNQRALSGYYHAADLFVLPSQYETWGLVVNEALHHGLPCMVSDQVGCAADLIQPGRTGEIFVLNDPSGLEEAMQRILPLMGRGEVRQYCRQHIAGYTLQKAAAGIAQAYHRIHDPEAI